MIYRFAECRLDSRRRELWRAGRRRDLARLPFDLLLHLLENPEEVHSKDRLVAEVWAGDFVSDASIARAVSQVRRAVGDDASAPRIIRTHYGRGYQLVAPVAVDVETKHETDPPPADRLATRRRVPGLLAVLGLGAAVAGALITSRLPDPEPTPVPPPRPSLAVLGFEALGSSEAPPEGSVSETEWIGVALGQWFATELAADAGHRTIPGEQVERMLRDLGIEPRPGLGEETLRRVADYCGADRVLVGSWAIVGDELRFDVEVRESDSARVLVTTRLAGPVADLFELVEGAGRELRVGLGLPSDTARGDARDLEAFRLHADALSRLHRGEASAARDLLLQAVAREPGSAEAWAALGRAWAALGYRAEARRAGERAVAAAQSLPRAPRRRLEARALGLAGHPSAAARAWWTLHREDPGDPEVALALAEALADAGRPSDSLDVVAELRRRPPPVGTDPRVALAEARAAQAASDFLHVRRAAREAVVAAAARGAGSLAAEARVLEAGALHRLGELGEAARLLGEAREVFADSGDRGAVARVELERARIAFDGGDPGAALASAHAAAATAREIGDRGLAARAAARIGVVHWRQGDVAAAREALETAAEVFAEIEDRKEEAGAINNLGALLVREGRLEEARDRFTRALGIHRRIGDLDGAARARTNLAAMAAALGDSEEARRELVAAAEGFREIGNRAGEATVRVNLAIQDRLRGRHTEAVEGYERAIRLAGSIDGRAIEATARFGLGEMARLEGRFAAAREQLVTARTLRGEIGDRVGALHARVALARVARAAGDGEEAQREIEGALAGLEPLGARDLEARAAALAAEIALDRQSLEAAATAVERARRLGAESVDHVVAIEVGLAAARLAAATGEMVSEAELRRLRKRAEKADAPAWELEVRLLAARLGVSEESPEAVVRVIEERAWRGLIAAMGAPRGS